MMSDTDADPSEYGRNELTFEELYGNPCDLKVESADGHTWYYVEMNGPCHPGFGEGHTMLHANETGRVTVSITVEWGEGEVQEHAADFRQVDHEPPEDTEDGEDDSEGPDDTDANPRTDGGETVMADGGEPVTEDASALDALRRELAASADDLPNSPEDISDDDVFQAARRDMTNSDGDLIIRFVGDRSGTTTVEPSPDTLFQDFYQPTAILMEYYGMAEGVSAALDRLDDAVDGRTIPDGRMGVLYVDVDSGRVTGVSLNTFAFQFTSSADVYAVERDMVDLANRDSEDSEPEVLTDGGEDAGRGAVEAFADSIANLMTGFSDVEPDEEYETTVKLFIRNREGDSVKVAVEGFTIIPREEHELLEKEVLDRVDLRKAPRPDGSRARAKTAEIGTVRFLGTGDVLEIDISEEYLKPSERGTVVSDE